MGVLSTHSADSATMHGSIAKDGAKTEALNIHDAQGTGVNQTLGECQDFCV